MYSAAFQVTGGVVGILAAIVWFCALLLRALPDPPLPAGRTPLNGAVLDDMLAFKDACQNELDKTKTTYSMAAALTGVAVLLAGVGFILSTPCF